ncbi:helix-turn-helix transcriptional regulator [Kocuria nitroreducens]|uniref:helix-turn-helix transcriptional regulator n=1 Tax=Kocuria nitroreducens TaxID=3058914 RepID=UPI0036DC68FE
MHQKTETAPETPIHLHVATTDPEVANEALQQIYTSARMGTVADESSFLYRQDVLGDPDLNLGRLTFRGSIAGRMVLDEVFSVVLPRAGGVDWSIDGRTGTGLGVFLLQPGQEYYGEVDQLLVDSVNIGLSTMQRTARTVYGDETLEVSFHDPRPRSPARERHWRSTFTFVQQVLAQPEVASVPLLRADLRRQMAVATLETFSFAGDPGVRRTSAAGQHSAYRRAVEFLHGAVSSPITVEDVARHAGTSTVELSRAFRSHAGTTPGAYLRELRLVAAHDDLVQGDPSRGDTVRGIALRWGMAHPGDFARRHRQAYGENPAATLRR